MTNGLVTAILVYYVEAVIQPAYQTMENHGRDCAASSSTFDGGKWIGLAGTSSSDSYDYLCDNSLVIAISGGLALLGGLVGTPVWKILTCVIGKTWTWLMFSLVSAVTNVLFICLPTGNVWLLFSAAFINGLPLGAKFLADSILSDIIDYDEFLTGKRSEATYFMFKSFLPKVLQIPVVALPVALLPAFGYLEPIGGKVQPQVEMTSWYLRAVGSIAVLSSLMAFVIKFRYPLWEPEVEKLSAAITARKATGNMTQPEPISSVPYTLKKPVDDQQQQNFWLLDSFSLHRLRSAFWQKDGRMKEDIRKSCESLTWFTMFETILSFWCLFCFFVAACFSLQLLWDDTWSFAPTLLVVGVGLSCTVFLFFVLRLKAAMDLEHVAEEGSLSARDLFADAQHREQLMTIGEIPSDSDSEVELEQRPLLRR